MIAWFARNDVAANLLMITIIIGGLYSLFELLKVEVFPEIEPDIIRVSVSLRGATPEDIELGVAIRIEEAVQDLEGIDKLTSHSVEGSTSVRIEVASGYNPRDILDDVKNRVDSINTFPAETENPVISLLQRTRSVIAVVVSGHLSEQEIRLYAEGVRDELLRQAGITQAQLGAVRRYEISVEVSQDSLRNFDLTLAQIATSIRHSSLDISAGNVRTEGGDVLIRSKGQAYRQNEYEDIVVKINPDGSIIRLGDIASVHDAFQEASLKAEFNGEFAALIRVERVGEQSALKIARQVKQYIKDKEDTVPVGLKLSYWNDDTDYLRARLNTLVKNALQGSILVILLLAMFLRPAVSFWVFIGIPISFLGAFILMNLVGVSINIMSAFGFILVLGIIVDDAIVTGENIYSRMRDGLDGLDAAVKGTKQVAVPVTFGILTTVAAFLPFAFVEGRMGDFLFSIPAVVIPCLIFSLIESKLVLPAHMKHIKINNGEKSNKGLFALQRKFADGFENTIIRYYQPLLRSGIRNRYTILTSFIGVFFLVIAVVISGWLKFTFFPRIESDTARVTLTMPVGTPFAVTDRHMQRITDSVLALQEKYKNGDTDESIITDILSTTGVALGSGVADHHGQVIIETIPADDRLSTVRMSDIVNDWRESIGPIPGAESLTFRAEIIRTGDPIAIQFSDRSLEQLAELGELVKERLATYPTVFDIADSLSDGKEELRIELTRQGHVLGLTRSSIVGQVSQAFRGFEAQRIQRGRDDIRVLVRLPENERSTLATLNDYLITTPDGRRVPLSHVAKLTPDKGPSTITRIDRYRVMTVTADVDKEKTNMVVLQDDLKKYIDAILVNYPGISYEMEGEAKEQRKAFGSVQLAVVLLLFVIYCLLALPLKSYSEPLIVMSVIPFGVIGAVLGHWIMGHTISFMSIMGLMALIGVVVNDSLVLVDFINQQKNKGIETLDAVVNAGQARFRPVLLTSLTTFIGLIPLTFEKSVQAQFLIPMAISLGFGVMFATTITLLMVPCNVMIWEDIRHLFSRLWWKSDATPRRP